MPIEQHDPTPWVVDTIAGGGIYCFIAEEASGECRLEDELGRRFALPPVGDPVHDWLKIIPTYPEHHSGNWGLLQGPSPEPGRSLIDAHLTIRVSAPKRYSISERLRLGGLHARATQVARDYRDFFSRWFPPKRLELKIESLW